MYITLDNDDYEEIARLICDCEDGSSHVYYSDYDICVYFYKMVQEHIENDYFNGTGAKVVDGLLLIIEKIELDDNSLNIVYDERMIEKYVKENLGL